MAEMSCRRKLDRIPHAAHHWGFDHDPSQRNFCNGYGSPLAHSQMPTFKTELAPEEAERIKQAFIQAGQQLTAIFTAMQPGLIALAQALKAITIQFQKDIEEARKAGTLTYDPECDLCDTDSHRCPGCGAPGNHIKTVCDNCKDIP